MSLSERPFADLTDVTLAGEDTNSILTDNPNRAIQGNVAMQVMQPDDQLWNQSKWRQLIEAMQVVPLGGPICNWCKWRHLVAKFTISASSATW